jgi:hypothetical protein
MPLPLACCGLDCNACPAYQATRAGRPAALRTVLQHWQTAYQAPNLTVADLRCAGCQGPGEPLNSYCRVCQIRPCARQHGVPNCGRCPEYPCPRLERLLQVCDRTTDPFFAYARQARPALERERQSS